MACGNDTEALSLYAALIAGENFSLPTIDLNDPAFNIPSAPNQVVEPITNEKLTTTTIGGDGTFDRLALAIHNHLKGEYEKNRITGAEYTKAYIALMESALNNAVQFLVQKEQQYWQAQLIQAQTIAARVSISQAKVQIAQLLMEAKTAAANYALTKMKLVTADVDACTAKFNLATILPKQSSLLTEQIANTAADTTNKVEQRALLAEQVESQRAQTLSNRRDGTPMSGLLGNQLAITAAQIELNQEQIETQRGQTINTRRDGTPITGTIGRQYLLTETQTASFNRDSEIKAARIFSEAWMTSKTVDEGVLPPDNFTNANLDVILAKLRANNGLV